MLQFTMVDDAKLWAWIVSLIDVILIYAVTELC